MKWGLIPSWARDASVAASMINATPETAGMKPAFGDALELRRCLIPADGFYEWSRTGKTKQPDCFEVSDGELFAFAGIWDRWKDASGTAVETCSILTTTPNAVTPKELTAECRCWHAKTRLRLPGGRPPDNPLSTRGSIASLTRLLVVVEKT